VWLHFILILNFRHKGLRRFCLEGRKSGIRPVHVARLRLILGWLGAAVVPNDMNLPGLRLHRLKGNRADRWSVWVSGNWRVTFAFDGEHVIEVDYEDYH
jgi:proteic killer suppression protein